MSWWLLYTVFEAYFDIPSTNRIVSITSLNTALSILCFTEGCFQLKQVMASLNRASVNIGSGSSLTPNRIEPLPDPMLIKHQQGLVAFAQRNLKEMLNICILYLMLKIIYFRCKCQWVKVYNCKYTYTNTNINTNTFAHTYTYKHTCTCTCTCIYTYIYIYISMLKVSTLESL